MLQNTLDHSTAIGVRGQSKHLHNTCTVNTHKCLLSLRATSITVITSKENPFTHTLLWGLYVNLTFNHSLWPVAMVTHLSLESINDELESMGLHTLNALLYYMVPILILHALQHMAIQLSYHITLHHTSTKSLKTST